MTVLSRRRLLIGAASCLLPAPAIVRASSIMPVRPIQIIIPTGYRSLPLSPKELLSVRDAVTIWKTLCCHMQSKDVQSIARDRKASDLVQAIAQFHVPHLDLKLRINY